MRCVDLAQRRGVPPPRKGATSARFGGPPSRVFESLTVAAVFAVVLPFTCCDQPARPKGEPKAEDGAVHRVRPGMTVARGELVRACDAVSWAGDRWSLPTDFQLFPVNGR